ncbi:putative signal transducing protein [uncultured Sunxiuqinia sp.]|uniref:putative signal transducing protein n=1 Tax=Sunxiuqinia rutila TaxID=1397841 RepID=UPI00260B2306|nr:DUF2007 domain-containing protein [uncultured Sunxiuqinia sp.]
MKNEDQLIPVYTGSQVSVVLLKAKLEDIGIPAIIRNDFQSGIAAGFGVSTPNAVDLYIQERDLEQAEPILQNFKE